MTSQVDIELRKFGKPSKPAAIPHFIVDVDGPSWPDWLISAEHYRPDDEQGPLAEVRINQHGVQLTFGEL